MGYNYDFGKIENNVFRYAPSPIVAPTNEHGGLWANDATLYLEHGYFPIEVEEMPVKEGYCYTPIYSQGDGKIIQSWEEHEEFIDETPLYAQAMKIVLGEEE